MRRIAVVLLGALVVLVVAGQLLGPGFAERRAEHRLERHGGRADVSVSAFPAVRLLFNRGDSLTVRGSGLRLDVDQAERRLERMDNFDEVSVRLDRLRVGPLHVRSFRLDRGDGEPDYRTTMSATTSGAEVGSFLGGVLGGLAGGALGGTAQIPVEVRAVIHSRDGNAEVRSAHGTVAGLPADPLVQVVVAAVAARL